MARKIVLADASPLIGLARVGGLPWLRKLYGTLSITKALRAEATGGRELPGAVALCAALKQGRIRPLRREWSEPPLPQLDSGEASTLRAAIALGTGTLVLLDDLQARREAQRLGIAMTGTAGIVVEARRAGLIPAARPVFARLAAEGGFALAGYVDILMRIAHALMHANHRAPRRTPPRRSQEACRRIRHDACSGA